MRFEFLCISVLRVASGLGVMSVHYENALTAPPLPTHTHTPSHPFPVLYTTDRTKAEVPVLFLLCVPLWLILRGDLY